MKAVVGERAPNLGISEWVQGAPTNLDQEKDRIVLVDVFQVNCPGCFMGAIPEAIEIYKKYGDEGVRVLGLATAFEDYDKNTLGNLRMLLETGEVVGDTREALTQYGQLRDGRLPYKIPFPVAMDRLERRAGGATTEQVMEVIYPQIPDFDSKPEEYRQQVIQRARAYLEAKEYSAETFERYSLQGTPSTILVDRRGVLRDVSFGGRGRTEQMVRKLISEG
ncbi:MAG: TlpA family protein disulfide reductase [Nitrosopumilus sp.]|nr:TlpA family protein disulfide reductase [Nitrosopumilus sp.]MDA7957778.1 TlpA family protein disulfide reductase [Nitrosopumilus sp.]